MANVTSGKMALFDWFRNILSVYYFPVMDHGPIRATLQLHVNKLRKAICKTQKKTFRNVSRRENTRKMENSSIIQTIQFQTIYLSGEIMPYNKPLLTSFFWSSLRDIASRAWSVQESR